MRSFGCCCCLLAVSGWWWTPRTHGQPHSFGCAPFITRHCRDATQITPSTLDLMIPQLACILQPNQWLATTALFCSLPYLPLFLLITCVSIPTEFKRGVLCYHRSLLSMIGRSINLPVPQFELKLAKRKSLGKCVALVY